MIIIHVYNSFFIFYLKYILEKTGQVIFYLESITAYVQLYAYNYYIPVHQNLIYFKTYLVPVHNYLILQMSIDHL